MNRTIPVGDMAIVVVMLSCVFGMSLAMCPLRAWFNKLRERWRAYNHKHDCAKEGHLFDSGEIWLAEYPSKKNTLVIYADIVRYECQTCRYCKYSNILTQESRTDNKLNTLDMDNECLQLLYSQGWVLGEGPLGDWDAKAVVDNPLATVKKQNLVEIDS